MPIAAESAIKPASARPKPCASPFTASKTGSRKRLMWPSSGGRPSASPMSADGTASTISGIVMLRGDSWAWAKAFSSRGLPWKVMKISLNM